MIGVGVGSRAGNHSCLIFNTCVTHDLFGVKTVLLMRKYSMSFKKQIKFKWKGKKRNSYISTLRKFCFLSWQLLVQCTCLITFSHSSRPELYCLYSTHTLYTKSITPYSNSWDTQFTLNVCVCVWWNYERRKLYSLLMTSNGKASSRYGNQL